MPFFLDLSLRIPYIVLWFNVCNKELLALRNNFRVTKKFLIAKFDCISKMTIQYKYFPVFFSEWHSRGRDDEWMLKGFPRKLISGTDQQGDWLVWQYGLWSFQTGGTRLERFLPKNQRTQRKLLNSENWVNGEVSKIEHHFSCLLYTSTLPTT